MNERYLKPDLKIVPPVERGAPQLDRMYLRYIGPINATAINRPTPEGGQRAFDQHSVSFPQGGIDAWEEGTLKVYCPSPLLAFSEGEHLAKLNTLLFEAEPLLSIGTPFLDAIRKTSSSQDYEYVLDRLRSYIDDLWHNANLVETILTINFRAYDRAIHLQKLFLSENARLNIDNLPIIQQAIIALARQKAIFIAMAPHYAVEAEFDDQFVNFPYHFPTIVHQVISKNTPLDTPEFNLGRYQRGMYYLAFNGPSPDMFRFVPILASLIAPYVIKEEVTFHHYDSWSDFQERVISRMDKLPSVNVFHAFAASMKIPLHFAYFAAYKMCQKECRKRGKSFLFSEGDAYMLGTEIINNSQADQRYYTTESPYLILDYYEETNGGLPIRKNTRLTRMSRKAFLEYHRALEARAAIEYINSVIGTYKFVPWVEDDKNFSGIFLPYAIMKSEKARIINALLDPTFSPYWRPAGYWFRDVLPTLLQSHPSMYSKWFIPLLEKGMIDEAIIKEALPLSVGYLSQLALLETTSNVIAYPKLRRSRAA